MNTNELTDRLVLDRAQQIGSLRAQGPACWDAEFYLAHNPDVKAAHKSVESAWEHYVVHGQFENRAKR